MKKNNSVYNDISEIIERWKSANPLEYHYLGIHDFDGEIPDYSKEGINKRIAELKEDIKLLTSMEKKYTDSKNKFEYNLVKLSLEKELFDLGDLCEFKDNPLEYIEALSYVEESFTMRSFASVEQRIDIILEFIKKIPTFINYSNEWLEESLPKAKVVLSIQFLTGIINYYKNSLIEFIKQTNDSSKIKKFTQLNAIAVKSMEEFLLKLQNTYLPKAHANFALGKDKFLKLLKKQENIDISFDKLLSIGEKDLERNFNAINRIIESKGGVSYLYKLLEDTPTAKNLVPYAKSTLDRTMNFLIEKDIVSMPTNEQCTVILTPESQRKFAFAAMNTPGPFEVPEAAEAYYYVTPADPTWNEEQTKNFLKQFNRASFEMITVHEVWPGHYLQLVYDRKYNTSPVVKMFANSTSMVEGYAHYTEEMIYNEGYDPFQDRNKIHVGQLLEALTRNVRYVVAIKMHCLGMTVEEAKQMFIEKAFLSEENAEIEARRGTIDPMYLNYTLGKLLIMKLRDDFKKEQKDNYSLKTFHDKLLTLGSAPITLLRSIILTNPTTEII